MKHTGHLVYWDDQGGEARHIAVNVSTATEKALAKLNLLFPTVQEAVDACAKINGQIDDGEDPNNHVLSALFGESVIDDAGLDEP